MNLMIIKVGKKKFESKRVILFILGVLLLIFLLGNFLFLVDSGSSPNFIKKIVFSETDFVNNIIEKYFYDGPVHSEGASCSYRG